MGLGMRVGMKIGHGTGHGAGHTAGHRDGLEAVLGAGHGAGHRAGMLARAWGLKLGKRLRKYFRIGHPRACQIDLHCKLIAHNLSFHVGYSLTLRKTSSQTAICRSFSLSDS